MDKKRKTEIYKLNIIQRNPDKERIDKKELTQYTVLPDFISYYFQNYTHSQDNNQKVTKKSKNICYFIDKVQNKDNTYSVILKYIKFNISTKVVDVDTLEQKYTKTKNEGDEKRQHYVLKTYNNSNKGVLVYEKIIGAVSIGLLKEHLNHAYRKWVKEKYNSDDNKKIKEYLLEYEMTIDIIPSPDFIQEINKMDKISLLKVTVNKEKLTSDEDILYSGDNVSRDDVDIIYKPIVKLSFTKSKIISYFEKFNKNRTKIKRLVINGRNNGNSISLDTEMMKLSEYISAEIDTDGLINSENILNQYKNLLNIKFKKYIDEIINKEIALVIDDNE